MSRTLLVQNVRYLVTCNDNNDVLENVSLLIKDGVIDRGAALNAARRVLLMISHLE